MSTFESECLVHFHCEGGNKTNQTSKSKRQTGGCWESME